MRILVTESQYKNLLKSINEIAVSNLPKKAELVKNDLSDFYNTLESAIKKGGLNQQSRKDMTYQKEVESLQVGLVLLGYDLPRYGVDGLFGPETASAVNKFIVENLKMDGNVKEKYSKATPEMITKLIGLLKEKNIQSSDIKPYIIKEKPQSSVNYNVQISPSIVSKFKEIVGDDYENFISDVRSIGLDPQIAIRQLYVESGFLPNVINCSRKSSAGAMGIAQFMPGTWKMYGEGSPCVVSNSLKAYVRYMRDLMKKFPGRPDLAVASYNSGPNLSVYRRAWQNDLDLLSLKGNIPQETYGYYRKIFQV